jgi:hypothetical protein
MAVVTGSGPVEVSVDSWGLSVEGESVLARLEARQSSRDLQDGG